MGKLQAEMAGAYTISIGALVGVWALGAATLGPTLLPSPLTTARVAWGEFADGAMPLHMLVSYMRILAGWTAGGLVGVALGLSMGRIPVVREAIGPLVEFARFIPPISFVTLFVIWFGVGEFSKILLIAYTTVFIVAINVGAGVAAINRGYFQAGESLGAKGVRSFIYIALPSSVPFIVTSMRLAMGNAFMTIVAAEILAAEAGVGYVIWQAQMYMQTATVFVGFAALCVMGFVTDAGVQYGSVRLLKKYGAEGL